jgi:hypothetical protein
MVKVELGQSSCVSSAVDARFSFVDARLFGFGQLLIKLRLTPDFLTLSLLEPSLDNGEIVVQARRSAKVINMIQEFIH